MMWGILYSVKSRYYYSNNNRTNCKFWRKLVSSSWIILLVVRVRVRARAISRKKRKLFSLRWMFIVIL